MKKYLVCIVVVLTIFVVGPVCMSVQAEDEQFVQEILADIEENYASFHSVLQEVKELNPEEYEKMLDGIINEWENIKEQEREDPEGVLLRVNINEMEIKISILEHEYYLVKSKIEKGKIKKEMSRVLNELFDLKIEERKKVISELEGEIEKLKTELEGMTVNKEDSVEKKIKELTHAETDVFDW